jgi:diguanylate cyclase (GGDEF)-like protein
MSAARLLYLDAAAERLEEVLGGERRRASSPSEARRLLDELRPDAIVVDERSTWARSVVGECPTERLPAVVAVGDAPPRDVAVDEWLAAACTEEEAALRLDLALARARSRRRAVRRAFVDPLTGLPNRRAAMRAAAREAARARRREGDVSLVLIDLDDFKAVNETKGHLAGDRVLREVGAELARATREHELSARVGGDEFAMIISGDLHDAQGAAHRVSTALRRIGVPATVACGELAEGERLLDLYRRTDDELRASKRSRRPSRSGTLRSREALRRRSRARAPRG